jgi:acyl carrier protein
MDMQVAKDVSLILENIFSGKIFDSNSVLRDLGFDSIAQIEFIVAIEEKFKIVIEPDEVKKWEKISEIYKYFNV